MNANILLQLRIEQCNYLNRHHRSFVYGCSPVHQPINIQHKFCTKHMPSTHLGLSAGSSARQRTSRSLSCGITMSASAGTLSRMEGMAPLTPQRMTYSLSDCPSSSSCSTRWLGRLEQQVGWSVDTLHCYPDAHLHHNVAHHTFNRLHTATCIPAQPAPLPDSPTHPQVAPGPHPLAQLQQHHTKRVHVNCLAVARVVARVAGEHLGGLRAGGKGVYGVAAWVHVQKDVRHGCTG